MKHSTRVTTARSSTDPDAVNTKWQTPPEVFAKLNTDFGPFDLDMTADSSNHLLPDWVGPGSPLGVDILALLGLINVDGFGCDFKSGYSNPPYDYTFLNDLIPLCALAARKKGFASTLLLPLRTTSEWWQFLLAHQHDEEGAAVIATCDSRIYFYENGSPRWNAKELEKGKYRADSAAFDSVIVHFAPWTDITQEYNRSTCFTVWQVPDHLPKIYREVL